jgi:hypothetical protein
MHNGVFISSGTGFPSTVRYLYKSQTLLTGLDGKVKKYKTEITILQSISADV